MAFTINEKNTPILFQQPDSIRKQALAFHEKYTSKKSVETRVAWGQMLKEIQNSVVPAISGKGDKAQQLNEKDTFSSICRELGVARSTAYDYINLHISVKTYPQAIQEAAAEVGLNLALDHVMAEYRKIVADDFKNRDLNDLTRFEVLGIIAQLEKAEAPKEEYQPITRDEFMKKLNNLIMRGLKSKVITVEDGIKLLQEAWEKRMEGLPEKDRPVPMPSLAKAATASAVDGLALESFVPGDLEAAKNAK
jgi:hypothetical protein